MTVTAILAGLSMAGIFPFFGFLAKEALLETVFHFAEQVESLVGWFVVVAVAVTGAFFVGYSFTLLWEAFLRRQNEASDPAHVHHKPAFSFVLPALLLTAIGTVAPFITGPLERLVLAPVATSIAGHEIHMHLALWHGWTPVLLTSLSAIAVGIVIFCVRSTLRSWFQVVPASFNGVYIFDKSVYWVYDLARWTTRTVQGGTLASQASVVVMSAVVLLVIVLSQFNWSQDLRIDWSNWPRTSELLLASLAIIAAILTVRATTRISAIVSSGSRRHHRDHLFHILRCPGSGPNSTTRRYSDRRAAGLGLLSHSAAPLGATPHTRPDQESSGLDIGWGSWFLPCTGYHW